MARMTFQRRAAIWLAFLCSVPLLYGVLCAPWLGRAAGPVLEGSTDDARTPRWSWWDRSLQETIASFVNERLPLRTWMTRLNNQLDYWLLRSSRDQGMIIGRDDVLFGRAYVAAALGYAPMMSGDTMHRLGRGLERLNALLWRRHIGFVVVGTPGKASFMRSAVPSAYHEFHPGAPRNYERFIRIISEFAVPFIDGRAEIQSSAVAAQAPYFPRGGLHWTLSAAYAALEKPMEKLLTDVSGKPGHLAVDQVLISHKATGTDADLLSLLNLLIYDRSYGTVDVKVHLEGSPLPRPIVLVGSSFAIQLQLLLEQAHVAPRIDLLFYLNRYLACATCRGQQLPPSWPQMILNDTSALLIELNEAAFFNAGDDRSYLDMLLSGLLPLLEPADSHPAE